MSTASVSTSFVLELALEITAILMVTLLAAACCRRASAALRHAILAAGMITVLLFPAGSWFWQATLPQVKGLAWLVPEGEESSSPHLDGVAEFKAVVQAEANARADESVGPAGSVLPGIERTTRPAQERQAQRDAGAAARSGNRKSAGSTFLLLLGTIWALGAGVLLFSWFCAARRLRAALATSEPVSPQLRRLATQVGIPGSVQILRARGVLGPLSCQPFRPTLLLPSDATGWSEETLRAVLAHENAHLMRKDLHLEFLRRVFLLATWMHPLAIHLSRSLLRERERACDDLALASGVPVRSFARTLVHLAARPRSISMALACPVLRRSSELESRVRALLDGRLVRRPASLVQRTFVSCVAGATACALAAVTAEPVAAASPKKPLDAWRDLRPDESPYRSRRGFARALAKLKAGMPAAEARHILGEPDDVRTSRDGKISTTRTKEIWRYGTNGHLTLPTLGSVYIDKNDQVQYVYGAREPKVGQRFAEQELRDHLRVLARVDSYSNGSGFHPRRLIRAVNRLQPLGREQALLVLDEFLRVTSAFHGPGRDGVFLVLRTLFEVPEKEGFMRRMAIGAFMPEEPSNKRDAPRYPIVLQDDIPFLIANGSMLAGRAERPESHLAYFAKVGVLRARPLRPTPHPVQAFRTLLDSPQWFFSKKAQSDWMKGIVARQVLRLVDSVRRLDEVENEGTLPRDRNKHEDVFEALQMLRIQWDESQQIYTFRDGTSLAPLVRKHYATETFAPKLSKHLEVRFVRRSERSGSFTLEQRTGEGDLAHVYLHDASRPDGPALASITPERRAGASPTSVQSISKRTKLAPGTAVFLVVTWQGVSHRSRVFVP